MHSILWIIMTNIALIVFILLYRIYFRKEISNHKTQWSDAYVFYWVMIILLILYIIFISYIILTGKFNYI